MTAAPSLPRWDLTPLFVSLEHPDFIAAFDALVAEIGALGALFDEKGIAARKLSPLTDADVAAYDAATTAMNELGERMTTVSSFLHAHVATDSRDAPAQAKASELRGKTVALSQLSTRYTAWLGSLDIDSLIKRSDIAAAHAYDLQRSRERAAHLMNRDEESLAAQLSLSGGSAWSRLHGDITSQLTVDFDGESQPMSVIRALATDPSRELRKRAYDAELASWKTVEVPLAAAMNAIKYETGLLAKRRGWSEALDAACFGNAIDRATLDAMLSAARASFPDFRRYLKAKARMIDGSDSLAWYDLFAPIGKSSRTWSWAEAEGFVAENFDAYSQPLGDFARRAFAERWIDAEPRAGKRDGAFCMSVRRGESRLLQNYLPSFDAVSTLAHELGHAYHNVCLKERTPRQSQTPMALAETASIFCQTIITNAAIAASSGDETLLLLEGAISDSCQVVVDITSRFDFEKAVLERRPARELSADELSKIMLDAQAGTYGDGLDPAVRHPYMWAVKGHYYGSTFYNFPYMFGLLFGLGLYARFQADPDNFRTGYDNLLSRTGMADAATLASDFGIDIRTEAFWTSSLDVIRAQIDRFVALGR